MVASTSASYNVENTDKHHVDIYDAGLRKTEDRY